MQSHFLISVMGTLGTGKTTAARLLADKLHCTLLTEQFEENPFLPHFYEDMQKWAFHSQTFFLLEKVRQLETIPAILKKSSVIQDTPIYQDVFSYAKAQKELGNMDQDEWHLYCKLYESLNGHLVQADLIVYLDASVETILNRIASRGRSMEDAIPEDYIRILHRLNHDWLKKNTAIPVYRIDTDHLNLVSSLKAQQQFVEKITAQLPIQ